MAQKHWILTANASVARLFERTSLLEPLIELADWMHPEGSMLASELERAPLGHSIGGRTGLAPRMDLKHRERLEFAHQLALWLREAVLAHSVEDIVLFASDPFMGELGMDAQALITWLSHALRRLAGCMAWLLIFLGCAIFSHAAWATAPNKWVIDKAELTSMAGRREVTLPHILQPQDYLPAGSRVRYRITVPLTRVPAEPLGVFVSKLSLSGALYINGQFILNCDQGRLEELRCLHKVNLFSTPSSVWFVGDNVIELELYATARQMNGLSKVQVGDLDELHDGAYWVLQWLKIEFLSGLAWVSALLGILSLAVSWVLRKEQAYLWFGIASIAHALGLLNLTVSNPVIHVEVFTWMVFSSRLVVAPMALLTMLSLFDKLRRWMILVLVGFALVGPLSRNPIKLITIGMALALVFSGMLDWLRLTGRTDFEGVFLFPYTYSAMLMTLGTLLFRNLATALKQSRIDRELLEMRAAERMAYEVTENIPVGTYTL
eukprot:gene3073-3003_t